MVVQGGCHPRLLLIWFHLGFDLSLDTCCVIHQHFSEVTCAAAFGLVAAARLARAVMLRLLLLPVLPLLPLLVLLLLLHRGSTILVLIPALAARLPLILDDASTTVVSAHGNYTSYKQIVKRMPVFRGPHLIRVQLMRHWQAAARRIAAAPGHAQRAASAAQFAVQHPRGLASARLRR